MKKLCLLFVTFLLLFTGCNHEKPISFADSCDDFSISSARGYLNTYCYDKTNNYSLKSYLKTKDSELPRLYRLFEGDKLLYAFMIDDSDSMSNGFFEYDGKEYPVFKLYDCNFIDTGAFNVEHYEEESKDFVYELKEVATNDELLFAEKIDNFSFINKPVTTDEKLYEKIKNDFNSQNIKWFINNLPEKDSYIISVYECENNADIDYGDNDNSMVFKYSNEPSIYKISVDGELKLELCYSNNYEYFGLRSIYNIDFIEDYILNEIPYINIGGYYVTKDTENNFQNMLYRKAYQVIIDEVKTLEPLKILFSFEYKPYQD